jgi:hypothetical protein
MTGAILKLNKTYKENRISKKIYSLFIIYIKGKKLKESFYKNNNK